MKVIDAIALIFTVGYFLLFATLVFHVVPPENREMLNALLGILSVVMLKIVEGYKELLGAKPDASVPGSPIIVAPASAAGGGGGGQTLGGSGSGGGGGGPAS